jgi:hypothetical protein
LASLFSKSDRGSGQSPAKTPFFLVLFLAATCSRKSTERIKFNVKNERLLRYYVRKSFSFFLSKEAQKEPKTPFSGSFAPAGATWDAVPSPCKLLKKFDQNF